MDGGGQDAGSGADRLAFCLANMVGSQVQVQTTNGGVYHGIFHAAKPEPGVGVGVVLKMAYRKEQAPGLNQKKKKKKKREKERKEKDKANNWL